MRVQTIELTKTPPLNWWRIFSCLTAVLMLSLSSWASADKWQLLTTPAPTPFLDVMLLMPDGSVMILSANDNQTWVKLTPDIYGNYVNGTWSTVGKMKNPTTLFRLAGPARRQALGHWWRVYRSLLRPEYHGQRRNLRSHDEYLELEYELPNLSAWASH